MKRYNKRLLAFLGAWILCLSIGALAAQPPLAFDLHSAVTSVDAGQELTVTLSVAENPGFLQATTQVCYDPAALIYISSTAGSFASGSASVTADASGSLTVSIAHSDAGYSGTGQLLTITFRVAEGYSGQTTLSTLTDSSKLIGPESLEERITVREAGFTLTVTEPGTHVHTEEIIPEVPATCYEPGLSEGIRCATCGEILLPQEYMDPLEHVPGEPVKEAEVAPGCQSDGTYESVVYCALCGDELQRETVTVPATGEHNFVNKVSRTEPTCTEDGWMRLACACGEIQETVLPATGHTEVVDPGTPPTCTEPGLSDGSHCQTCGEVLSVGQALPAKGHTEQVLPGYSATCMDTGLTDGLICGQCGEVLLAQEETPIVDHSPEFVPETAPTCTETGLTEGQICAFCGIPMSGREEIPARGHTAREVEAKEPTCAEYGYTAGTRCRDCDTALSGCDRIEKLPHTEEVSAAVAPTCSTPGASEGRYCTVCGEITLKPTVIPTIAHTEQTVSAVEPTCAAPGWTEGVCCAVCGEMLVEPQQIPTTAHRSEIMESRVPTCTQTGLTEGLICVVCNQILQTQEEIPMLEHQYDHGCDVDCNACGSARASLQHAYGSWHISKEATKDSPGQQTRMCGNCGHLETRDMASLIAGDENRGLIIGVAYVVMAGCVFAILILLRKKRKESEAF